MKRPFYTFLTALAMLAVACNPSTPDEPTPGPGPDVPDEPDEPEYVAAIKIDGKFDDWDKIDASKLAVANCAADSKTKALKTLKVYSDEFYIFFYFEYDSALLPDKSDVQCHFYFDADNDVNTGGYANQFSTAGFNYMGEGHIYQGDAICSFDPSISEWTGEAGASGWDWETIYSSGSGIFEGNGDSSRYEVSLLRDSFHELGEEFLFGMDIQQTWSSVGILPNADVTESNTEGKGAPLAVKVAK